MIESTAAVVAVIAALIAALSALYARWQAIAVKRANEIALREDRLRVFKGLSRFRVHISANGTGIKVEEAWRFAEVAELSEFYFPPEVHTRLEGVFQNALRLLSLNDEWEEMRKADPERAKHLVEPRHALMRATRDECYILSDLVKVHLRVGEA